MDRVAVFVDAGYLIARGSEAKWGTGIRRKDLLLDVPAICGALIRFAERVSGLPLLRIYWYDAARRGWLNPEQLALANQRRVKLRLGALGYDGKQKGVDSLLVTDLITLARNRAMAECVLVAGDEDLRVGVQQAQEHGVPTHLLGIAASDGFVAQSILLRQEADEISAWTVNDIGPFLERVELTPAANGDEDTLGRIAKAEAHSVPETSIRRVLNQFEKPDSKGRAGYLDPLWNKRLLGRVWKELDRKLEEPAETDRIRSAFVEALRTRLEPDAERETNDD